MSETQVINMGCRLNAFESEAIRGLARKADLRDTIIFNTCAVTAEAERQARQLIRREKRRNPGKRIIVVGCGAQLNPKEFSSMPEVDYVLGNDEKLRLEIWRGLERSRSVQVSDIMNQREILSPVIKKFKKRARAFVQVQQGCDHRCTFCIIPFSRGVNRSLPVESLVEQADGLTRNGHQEIVLTGVDLCSYGKDTKDQVRLGDMLRILLDSVPRIKRLRLSSLDPASIDPGIFNLLENEPRLMPHIHLSIQSLDDMILKRMKRRHTVRGVWEVIEKIRAARPGIAIGADLIAGFPTETSKMFKNTITTLVEMDIPFLHVFPFSERPGTPAAKMPKTPIKERKERAAMLRHVGEGSKNKFLQNQFGSVVPVLVERGCFGRTEHSILIEINNEVPAGEIADVLVTGVNGSRLEGKSMDGCRRIL